MILLYLSMRLVRAGDEMKAGDMVRVTFTYPGGSVVGIFISDDVEAWGRGPKGDKVITRAHVLWEGQIYSTPLDQLEIISAQ
jgi:hypothetical protein